MQFHQYSSDQRYSNWISMKDQSNKRMKYKRVKELVVFFYLSFSAPIQAFFPFCNFKPVQFAANPEFSNVPRHGFALAQFVSRRRRNRILSVGRVGRGGKREREGKSFRRPLEDRDYDSLLGQRSAIRGVGIIFRRISDASDWPLSRK